MSWERYYEIKHISPFSMDSTACLWAINHLYQLYPHLPPLPESGKTIVLGGFTHTNSTEDDFIQFCYQLDPNPHMVILDLNRTPLENAHTPDRIQADLTYPPLAPNSIDLIVMDYTQQFMTQSQLQKFFEASNMFLRHPSGLVIMVNDYFVSPTLAKLVMDSYYHVPTHPHNGETICDLSPSKPVLKVSTSSNDILIFAHPDSPYPKFTGNYLYYSPEELPVPPGIQTW